MNVSEEQIDNAELATPPHQDRPGDEPSEVRSEGDVPADAQASEPVPTSSEEPERFSKRKLEEQLEALKRKEAELRRALVVAEHPELADAIRLLQGRTYALERSAEKLALGLTKAELRRRETLQKKRTGLEQKRAELDAEIAGLDGELLSLGVERQRGYEAEHRQALEELLLALGAHVGEVQAAGLDVGELLPDLKRWMPEIERLAAQKNAN
jgi:hypothetical protein